MWLGLKDKYSRKKTGSFFTKMFDSSVFLVVRHNFCDRLQSKLRISYVSICELIDENERFLFGL